MTTTNTAAARRAILNAAARIRRLAEEGEQFDSPDHSIGLEMRRLGLLKAMWMFRERTGEGINGN